MNFAGHEWEEDKVQPWLDIMQKYGMSEKQFIAEAAEHYLNMWEYFEVGYVKTPEERLNTTSPPPGDIE